MTKFDPISADFEPNSSLILWFRPDFVRVAETFRKQYQERVVDRRWERGTNGAYVTKQVDALPVPKSKPEK
jgi:hypothetical protein